MDKLICFLSNSILSLTWNVTQEAEEAVPNTEGERPRPPAQGGPAFQDTSAVGAGLQPGALQQPDPRVHGDE